MRNLALESCDCDESSTYNLEWHEEDLNADLLNSEEYAELTSLSSSLNWDDHWKYESVRTHWKRI